MIQKFLKARHWQLFILMFGIPILFQIIVMGSIFSNLNAETSPEPVQILSLLKFYPLLMVLYMGVFFGWFWSIAIGLQSKVPEHIVMKTKKFKVFFFIPLVYILVILIFVTALFTGVISIGTASSNGFKGLIMGGIVLLHLFSMFGIFYSMYFVAKTIKTVELQKEVSFGEFAGEFFMLWFYFVGIWIIQPKINKMVA